MASEPHKVGEIKFFDELSYMVCTCGTRIEHVDPERIAVAYQDHRVASGLKRRSLSESAFSDGRSQKLSIRRELAWTNSGG